MPAQVAPQIIKSARAKLYAARLKRPTPFIDKTQYTGWNAMCISAFVQAGRVFGQPQTVAFAIKSLDRALTALQHGTVAHVIAYSDTAAPHTAVPGTLDDYVFLAHACLDAWEATGEPRYYAAAEEIATTLLSRFYDGKNAGFFDTPAVAADLIGALAVRRKPIQDAPTPAGNPAAAALLLRLYPLNGRETYRDNAQETLESFASVIEHLGLYAATSGLALARLGRPAIQVVIVGEGPAAAQLELMGLTRYAVNKTVIRLRLEQLGKDQLANLPPALAETLPNLPVSEVPIALVCSGFTCQPPITKGEDLIAALNAADAA